MVRQVENLHMAYLNKGNTSSIHDNIVTWRKMLEIASHHQLIVITHLPQIAAQGKTHFSVLKKEAEGRTVVSVRKLGMDERVNEIAKLLGGEQITPQAKENAKELLGLNNGPSILKPIEENLKV